jgi:hypothetical protein
MTSLTAFGPRPGGGRGGPIAVVAAPAGSGQDGRVPVSEALRRLSEDPGFWTGEPATDPDARELRVAFPVIGGYALVLDLDPSTGERALGLRQPASTEPVQLGRAPGEGPYPAALRWWELELCARVIALADPLLPHPGLVVALLSPFAPATPDDDELSISAVREVAYRSLRRDVPPALLQVRTGSRFPHRGLADLVRRAAAHLDQMPAQQGYAEIRPLARHIAESGDLRPLPALLGALTEAGCDHPTVLDALSEPLEPIEACWMVETLAGAEPGTLLRRHV